MIAALLGLGMIWLMGLGINAIFNMKYFKDLEAKNEAAHAAKEKEHDDR